MVQFCCGNGDCEAAGANKRSAKFGSGYLEARGGGGGGAYLYRADGTKIEPIAEGPPPEADTTSHAKKSAIQESSSALEKRDDCPPPVMNQKRSLTNQLNKRACKPDKNSWEANGESYTRPSAHTTILRSDVNGGSGGTDVQITKARSQSWSTSAEISIGFADIFSMGVSLSQETSCEISESNAMTFKVPAGQTGNVGFTAYLSCQEGKRPITPYSWSLLT